MATDVTIIQPTMMDGDLRYQVEFSQRPGHSPVKRWLAATAVQPSAISEDWEYAWWNRETETYEDPPSDEQS